MIAEIFVPGRLCLMGEHSDWAGEYQGRIPKVTTGMCLVAAVNQGIYATATENNSLEVTSHFSERDHFSVKMNYPVLVNIAKAGGFWRYIAGVAAVVSQDKPDVKGLKVDISRVDLPMKKGLSSSAAICVLIARAFNQVYQLNEDVFWEMEMAYLGERLTGSLCGRMDQSCGYPEQPVLLTFSNQKMDINGVKAASNLYLVLVDLGGAKNTVLILETLNLALTNPDHPGHAGLVKLLGKTNQELVHAAVEAVNKGDDEALGGLMNQAQIEFDKYAGSICPQELSSPRLHEVLEEKKLKPFIWGGKGVGSQGDGTAQLLAKSKTDQQKLLQIVEGLGFSGIPLVIKSG